MWSDVRGFVENASNAGSVGKLNQAFGHMIEGWGFDNFIAIQVSSRRDQLRSPLARSFGSPPVLWLDRYRQAGHVHHDAGIMRIMASTEPFWWSHLQDLHLSPAQRAVLGEASEFGINHGLVVPVRQPDGSVWSCALSAHHLEESDDLKIAAVVAANYFVGRGLSLQMLEPDPIELSYRLTPRQREVVTWLARGMTSAEIGDLLGTSPRTVAHQIEDAKRRLGARTVASLVAEAIIRDEIAPE
jgi:LuxR family transcriptional regulator, quorum-sensing system regulator CciR